MKSYPEIKTPAIATEVCDIISKQIGKTIDPDKARVQIHEYDHDGQTFYAVMCYQDAVGGDIAENGYSFPKQLIDEFVYWSFFREKETVKEWRELVTKILRDAGYYPGNTEGLRYALKIYEMISYSKTKLGRHGVTAVDLLYLEEYFIELTENGEPMEYPKEEIILTVSRDLKERGTGRMSQSAKRALKALEAARLIKAGGKTSGTRYYLEKHPEMMALSVKKELGIV